MAINYEITARELVKELGGDENIINVTHCATRLRFILKDESGIDSAKVARIPGVITTVQAGGQYQVVIGNHVSDAYAQVMKLITVDETAAVGEKKKTGIVSGIIDVISSIFAPFLYTLAKMSDYYLAYYVTERMIKGEYNITTQVPVLYLLEALGRRLMAEIS